MALFRRRRERDRWNIPSHFRDFPGGSRGATLGLNGFDWVCFVEFDDAPSLRRFAAFGNPREVWGTAHQPREATAMFVSFGGRARSRLSKSARSPQGHYG